MLHDLDESLKELLYERGQLPRRDINITFETPTGEWSASLNRPTLNLWCFDLRENLKRRVSGLESKVDGNQGFRKFPARRMDATYLITAWARKVEDEHQIIWRALETLKVIPSLFPQDCVGALRYQKQNIPVLVAEPNELGINMPDLWGVLNNQMKLGFMASFTLELDTEFALAGPLVLDATVTVGKSDRPQDRTLTEPDVEIKHPKVDRFAEEAAKDN